MRTVHSTLAWIALTLAAALACDQDPVDLRKSELPEFIPCQGPYDLQCPEGLVCVDDGSDDCDFEDGDECPGHCQPSDPVACGGIAGFACPGGQLCLDDPGDDCDPTNGGADCMGICQPPPLVHCGGGLGFGCPNGQICVDDPYDDCDPAHDDVGCIGVCEPMPVLGGPTPGER
ncbi:hypothetical protein [Nannocystis sp. SCPEA4]|uniref:hypothetical protein n=1 Tax=Nannocystis sp. SCPEA4 TaxID=2996787 RepID=UPI00226F57E0|nr:hypothetical protein [Nannocystis sp. SCPEA4]MCY1059572.1 hypothetical protein [Nannocystis sp. SCPEA4]